MDATLNITYKGQNGTLPDMIRYDATNNEILGWATEAIRGGFPGINADPDVDLNDFVVDRFPADGDLPNRIFCRPKTPFGK
jgi:hypothetical protein